MDQYTISSKQRFLYLGMMALGVICMALTWMGDDTAHHARFWSNFLHNAVFFTGIALMATFFIGVCITAWAGWHTVLKRVWEGVSMFLFPGVILMLIIALGVKLHWHHLYHWADPNVIDPTHKDFDPILLGKAGFLNTNVYLFATIIVGGLWCFFAYKFRQLSLAEDSHGGDAEFKHHRSLRVYAATFLPIFGFSMAAMIWLWIMSIDSHWYSTMFAWYTGASWFVSMIAVTILILIFLKGKGYYKEVTGEHIHDLGKFLFAFSIFWAYLWFSQYMLIWYANVGEETIYFRERLDHYPVLFYGNLVVNFALPFLILMRNDTKRKFGSVSLVAVLVIFGHWWDFFQMIKPGVLITANHGHETHGITSGFSLPGLLEIGTGIGFLGLFFFVVYSAIGRAKLVPTNDPYLEESLHHHV